MTPEQENSPERTFVRTILPWVIAAAAVVVYAITLNHWVGLASLGPVAKLSGWTWQPQLNAPLYWLATYPLHWLPLRLIPLGLNLFSALCAGLTLALLARAVTLLPHDRTEEQRLREKSPFALLSIRSAWLPPVLAVLVCGLQLTFWENATVGSGEMLDLLLFAYIVRCVLEYRVSERDSWLLRASFVCGAAMTNNWGMIGFFPVFLVALVWSKGVGFFNGRFLTRMTLCGLAGLLLYLLLPLVNSLSSTLPISFWQALKFNLASQKGYLTTLVFNKDMLLHGDRPLWVLALPSLLPLLIMAIRWPSYFGDPSKLGVALATLAFHCFHGLLLLVCVWVAMDPQFSPRHYNPGLPHYGANLLPFYFLGALSVGYFSGYFLLVFGARPLRRPRLVPGYMRLLNTAVTCAVWALVLVATAALLYRNLPQIRTTNGPMLKRFASLLTASLPKDGAVVLSDDPIRSVLLQSALAQNGNNKQFVVLDTDSLRWPDYHRFLKRNYPRRWPGEPPKDFKQPYEPLAILQIVSSLSQSNALYYLHPSFGYYFEVFYLEPHGLVYKLQKYSTNSLFAPPLSQPLIDENERFWSTLDQQALQPLVTAIAPAGLTRNLPWPARLLKRAHLTKESNPSATMLASFYSRALDYWGVAMQRQGLLPQAARHFARAVNLNPDNVAAQVNLECNRNLQAGRKPAVALDQSLEDQFGKYRSWDQIMNQDGPFDHPTFCFEQGRVMVRGNNYRQGAEELARVKALSPENLPCRLLLAQLYLLGQRPDEALKETAEIHAQAEQLGLARTNQPDLLMVEASAHLAKKDLPGAQTVVQAALTKYPGDEALLATALQAYLNFQHFSNALEILDRQLKIQPDDPKTLCNQGYALMQLNAPDQAIAPLSRVVAMETNNFSDTHYLALLNRAIAYLRTGKLDDAQSDYEALQKAFPTAYKVAFGLQDIFYRKHETNTAIRYCELYLANAPTNTLEASNIVARLEELEAPQKPKGSKP